MRRKGTWMAIVLCILLVLGMTACKDGSNQANVTGEASSESIQASEESTAAKETTAKEETEKETTETKDSSKESTKQKTKKASSKEAKKATSKETSKKSSATKAKAASNEKPSGHVLTVKQGKKTVYFTESQLANMGKSTYKYSFRNKDSEHRQFVSYKGVKFSTILSKSELSGSTARFHSTDGYTKEYSVSDLKSTKKAFLKKSGSSSKNVPAILTLGDSESFRLCFGQAADDSDENGDYNAQYWIKWIDTIELY